MKFNIKILFLSNNVTHGLAQASHEFNGGKKHRQIIKVLSLETSIVSLKKNKKNKEIFFFKKKGEGSLSTPHWEGGLCPLKLPNKGWRRLAWGARGSPQAPGGTAWGCASCPSARGGGGGSPSSRNRGVAFNLFFCLFFVILYLLFLVFFFQEYNETSHEFC